MSRYFVQEVYGKRFSGVNPLGHYEHALRRRVIHNTKSRMYMMFGETKIAEVSELQARPNWSAF